MNHYIYKWLDHILERRPDMAAIKINFLCETNCLPQDQTLIFEINFDLMGQLLMLID